MLNYFCHVKPPIQPGQENISPIEFKVSFDLVGVTTQEPIKWTQDNMQLTSMSSVVSEVTQVGTALE